MCLKLGNEKLKATNCGSDERKASKPTVTCAAHQNNNNNKIVAIYLLWPTIKCHTIKTNDKIKFIENW